MNDSDRGDLQDRGQNLHGADRHKRDQAPGLASNSSCVKSDMAQCRHNADHDLDADHDKLGDDSPSESHVKAKAEECRDEATCTHVKAKPPRGDFTKIILIEPTVPPHCPVTVELERIPTDLKWKFVVNPDTPRYWVKLSSESCTPPLGKETRKHESKNVYELRKTLEPILRDKLKKESKINYWCEARLGRLVWRDSENKLLEKLDLRLSDVCSTKESDKEFYTRTTTKTDEMIKKLEKCCLEVPMENPRDIVSLRIIDMEKKADCEILLDEHSPGTFTQNNDQGFIYAKSIACNKAEFVCIGRSHDLRVASDFKRHSQMNKFVPNAAKQAIKKIAESVRRTDTGQLKLILKSGCVKVEHVRQKRSWNFTTKENNFGINFYELKETNARPLSPMEDEMVTLEHNTNQEIEVEMRIEVNSQDMIPGILDKVEKLVDFALDVVDMAEECKDPDILY